jgi:outer membrane lipoprotein-sorting protein
MMLSHRHRSRPHRALLSILAVLGAVLCAAAPVHAASPWDVLEAMRADLEKAGPTTAQFVQSYLPAGFSSAERESGRLSLDVPDCLRWDYEEPEVKAFLICRGQVHSWSGDDPVGYRYRVDPEREPGLDLLLLSVDELRLRYRAENRERRRGVVELRLAPVQESAQLKSAVLVIDTVTQRILQLEYQDAEGNETSFDILGYQPLDNDSAFNPPSYIEWRDE